MVRTTEGTSGLGDAEGGPGPALVPSCSSTTLGRSDGSTLPAVALQVVYLKGKL
jgi:hypothetical protein